MSNSKRTSPSIASLAAITLQNSRASGIQKTLAGSAMAQAGSKKVTGAEVEDKASAALRNPHSSDVTKSLAGAVLSQSDKKR